MLTHLQLIDKFDENCTWKHVSNVIMIDTVDKKCSFKFIFQGNPGYLLKIGKIPGHSRTFQDFPGLWFPGLFL